MNIYLAKAQFLLGYIDLRFNRMYQDRDKNAEINLWAGELSNFEENDLNDTNMKDAIDWYVDMNDKKCFAPTVDQFCEALKKIIYKPPLKIEQKNVDYFARFDNADNRGKFDFFMKNRNMPPVVKWYAKTWFIENTKFKDDQIIDIVNDRLPK